MNILQRDGDTIDHTDLPPASTTYRVFNLTGAPLKFTCLKTIWGSELVPPKNSKSQSISKFWHLGWVGLGVTTGRGSKTLSKIFSLASNHQFTHFDFTSGGVIPGKIPLHSHMCTGEFTKTGVTLTVFLQYSSWYSIYFNPQEPGESA